MKTKITKVLALTLCAVLLVVGSVMGTVAYLTDQDSVTNTFTYGNVKITLTEHDYDNDSNAKENDYKLVPGQTYKKDTTIHVEAGSEACYLFVKIDEKFANSIFTLNMAANWQQLEINGVKMYYYNETVPGNRNVPVMISFKVAETAEVEHIEGFNNVEATIVAYAVQADGFTSAEAAWAATFSATVTPSPGNGTT